MTPLAANLKHLYQCRSLWLLHVFIFPAAVSSCLAPLWWWPDEQGPYSFHLLTIYLLGYVVAHMQRGVLGKTFTYGLPGHHEMPRRLLFRVGWGVCLLFSLVYLNYPGQELLSRFSMVAANTFLGMALYLAAAIVVFLVPGVYQWAVWMSAVFIAQIFNSSQLSSILNSLLRLHPLELIIGSGLWALLVWRMLSGRRLARAHCGELFLGFTEGLLSLKKQERVMQAWRMRKGEKKAARSAGFVETLFLDRIRGAHATRAGWRGWGTVYTLTAKYLNRSLGGYLLFFLGFVLFFGYLGSWSRTPFAYFHWLQAYPFLMVVLTGLFVPLPAFGDLPLPAGRRERFWDCLTFAFVLGVTMTAACLCIAGLAARLEGLLPELEIRGRVLSFLAPNLRNGFLHLVVMPFLFAFQLCLPQHSAMLRVIPLLVLLWSLPFWYGSFIHASPVVLMSCILLGWASFITFLFPVLSRNDLVSQRQGQ